MKTYLKFFLLAILLLSSAAYAQEEGNLTEGCVESYDASVDYFPDKVSVDHAAGFEVEYFNNYKVVSVTPWRDAENPIQYVLVQCGTPTPEGFDDATVIEVPIETIIPMSTTYLPHLDALGLVDNIIALDSFDFAFNPAVRERIDAGEIEAIGTGSTVNVEVALNLEPDLIMVFGSGFPEYDTHPVLIDAGINVALSADYLESDPLGQAEWGKFIALFFNKEAEINTIFDNTVAEYEALVALTADVAERPTVFTGSTYDGTTWYIPGGNSYTAKLLADAGADYLFADVDSDYEFNIPTDVEMIVDEAVDADFWVNTDQVFWNSVADVLASDERYAEFTALENGGLFNNNARATASGGSDYFESGAANPQVILADMIKIFHPELLPDHELFYYQQLQ